MRIPHPVRGFPHDYQLSPNPDQTSSSPSQSSSNIIVGAVTSTLSVDACGTHRKEVRAVVVRSRDGVPAPVHRRPQSHYVVSSRSTISHKTILFHIHGRPICWYIFCVSSPSIMSARPSRHAFARSLFQARILPCRASPSSPFHPSFVGRSASRTVGRSSACAHLAPAGRVRHASPTCTDVRHATRTAAHSSPARHRTRRAHPSHLLRPAGRPTPPHPLHGGTRVARRTPYALRPRGTPRSLASRRSLHPALRASHV